MVEHLRQALARAWEWLRGRAKGRGLLSRRARFWAELREGQREAEAQRSRPRS